MSIGYLVMELWKERKKTPPNSIFLRMNSETMSLDLILSSTAHTKDSQVEQGDNFHKVSVNCLSHMK